MATPGKWPIGDKQTSAYPTRQPPRWRRNLIALALVLAAGILAWSWRELREEALAGSAFGAQAGCVCRYVSQRPLESCTADLKVAGLGRVAGLASLSEDAASKTVTAGVPLLARQSASFNRDAGCQLKPWDQ